MSQTMQNNSFDGLHRCDDIPDYSILYKINNTTRTNTICKNCITSQVIFDDDFGKLKILQLNIREITCLYCGDNVTESKGCRKCKIVFAEEKKLDKPVCKIIVEEKN